MSRPYPDEDFDDAADRLADEDVQVVVDDVNEVKAVLNAFFDGREVGRQFGSPEMNPHTAGSKERAAWERGRLASLSERFH